MKIFSDRHFEWIISTYLMLIPVSPFLGARLLVAMVILVILTGRLRIQDLILNSWDLLFFCALLVLGMVYTSDTKAGLGVLETSFGLIGTPIALSSVRQFDRHKVIRLLGFFYGGVLFGGLICLINASIQYYDMHDINLFFFHNLTGVINSHPTYFAYFLILAITFALYVATYEDSIKKTLVGATSGFCFILLLLTGGLTAFVSLLYVISFFILKFLLSERSPTRFMVFALSLIMLVTIILVNSSDTSNRQNALDDSWDRFELWTSAIKASPDFIFGVGTGGHRKILNDYYVSHSHPEWAKENMNAHNQFIQTSLTHGILGLLALLIILLRPIYLAFRRNDQFGILAIFPFLIYGITEVFLGRFQGVVFFAMVHQLFIQHYMYSDCSIEVKPSASSLPDQFAK